MENTLNTIKKMTAIELNEKAITSFESNGFSREEAIKIVNTVDHSQPFHTPESSF
jgi:hypothetical protein